MKDECDTAAEVNNVEMTDSDGKFTEVRIFYGAPVDTPELNQVKCGKRKGCVCLGDRKWCFLPTGLEVDAPDKWVFTGTPFLQCTRDNQGSAAWNHLGAPGRFFVSQSRPNQIRAAILTSSRSIAVRLCCEARYYPK